MIKRSILALLLVGAVGCSDTVQSPQPFFTGDAEGPRAGLWALLEPSCPRPANAAVETWPTCASPMWLREGALIMIVSGPVRSSLVLVGEQPQVAQVTTRWAGDDPGVETRYFAVEPTGRAPFETATVWKLPCPDGGAGSLAPSEGDDACRASSAREVLQLAERARRGAPSWTAAWIAAPGQK